MPLAGFSLDKRSKFFVKTHLRGRHEPPPATPSSVVEPRANLLHTNHVQMFFFRPCRPSTQLTNSEIESTAIAAMEGALRRKLDSDRECALAFFALQSPLKTEGKKNFATHITIVTILSPPKHNRFPPRLHREEGLMSLSNSI